MTEKNAVNAYGLIPNREKYYALKGAEEKVIKYEKHWGGHKMSGFIIGLFIGGLTGVFTMCMCTAAGQADKRKNCTGKDK